MNQRNTFDSSYNFIELNRTFRELSDNSFGNDDVNYSQAFSVGKHLSWSNLITGYRLIILSEAGTGKTAEIRNVARTLREQGKPAFFLRLENISRDFEDAFEVGSSEEFEEWLASSEEGWLLLDSVDEARLRDPGDFVLAIRNLSRRIITAKDRTHIIITGRTPAWRPKTDLAHCDIHLPYTAPITSVCDSQSNNDETIKSAQTETETDTQSQSKSVFKIVALDDLTSDQIKMFVTVRGIKDSKAFIDAVERADAWSFTSRPQDLEELIEFWLDKGRIGTRLDIMKNSIDRRLTERDQDRADLRPISAERIRQGAKLLAATTTLVQNPTIQVPDGSKNSKGIAVQFVLPDWDNKDLSTLLLRPIFDEEIYGAVRFHHRSVREYLAAEWFAELLNREVSRRTIEGLFFRNQYGMDIIVPTLRPILPWLAILDDKIRERVLKIAPEIIFEGGDPTQLPLEVRHYILREVCEQMANGATDRSMRDYAAVQRFASADLTDNVRTLLCQYAENEDLTAFLLRMVWLGQLEDALPEALEVALAPTSEQYTRITAFRAIQSIGSSEDQEHVRQCFLSEAPELKREWFAELLKDVQPTEQTLVWLLECLEKSESKEQYAVDYLTDNVTAFVEAIDIELLPQLVAGLNRLLSLAPVIERRYCEVSEKFQWLMVSACKAVERLIVTHHRASLEHDVLDILHKFPVAKLYGSDNLDDVKIEFSNLVPPWKELNRILFWFEIKKSREVIDKKRGERLTNFWQSSIFSKFWKFEESDFEYVTAEISHQTFMDDKLVALSVAFDLYKTAGRPRRWREKLKKLAGGNNELSERLKTFLSPPAQSKKERGWKKQETKWKRQAEARRKRQEQNLAESKKFLTENLDAIRTEIRDKPGIITGPLYYLYQQARHSKHTSRWTEYNWKTLIPEYGEEVARFYRDGTVAVWRNHEPTLRSEGAPADNTTHAVIIGLTGLEIEATEAKAWPKDLSAAEAELACKYASFELNGFPIWLPKLFEAQPQIVCDFFMREIRYELSKESAEVNTHYILCDVSGSGQWAWDLIAPSIYDLLKREPKNLSNLDKLLTVIQGANLPDGQIAALASRKCRTLKTHEHLARWFAVWTGVAPEAAISAFKTRIGKISTPDKQTSFAMIFVTHLLGGRSVDGTSVRQRFKTPSFLKSIYLLMHEHIRYEEDVKRAGKGVYSPELRDDAQDARNSLLSVLNQIPGKESFFALLDIAKDHPNEASRPWIIHHAKTRAEQDGDIESWSASQVRDFHEELDRTPDNHRELAELTVSRFHDLKDDLEHGDSSIADILKKVTQETEMRKYIGRELREKALGRYSIPQEEELADAKRPDLRIHGVGFDGPVPVELKLADNKWGGPKLFERLENQLCGDYLRDNRSTQGIFVLVYRGEKSNWELPGSGALVDFAGLIAALQDHWLEISPKFPKIDDIKVIGIDLTVRSN